MRAVDEEAEDEEEGLELGGERGWEQGRTRRSRKRTGDEGFLLGGGIVVAEVCKSGKWGWENYARWPTYLKCMPRGRGDKRWRGFKMQS